MNKLRSAVWLAVVFSVGLGAGGFLRTLELPKALTDPTIERIWSSPPAKSPTGQTYTLATRGRSYFARDSSGNLIPEQSEGRRYYKVGEEEYTYQRTLNSAKTALVVMDPWEDSGSDFLNRYYAGIARDKLLPLVSKAIELGMPVLVLTNDPKKTPDAYGSKVFPELQAMADKRALRVLYHQDFDGSRFADYLRSQGVDTLIYSGFASNMCVIGRDLGMIPMAIKGFRMFFVPEASAAVEFKDSWHTGAVHQATTSLISQWVGELIDLRAFLGLKPGPLQ